METEKNDNEKPPLALNHDVSSNEVHPKINEPHEVAVCGYCDSNDINKIGGMRLCRKCGNLWKAN